jgi:hypothetical protein
MSYSSREENLGCRHYFDSCYVAVFYKCALRNARSTAMHAVWYLLYRKPQTTPRLDYQSRFMISPSGADLLTFTFK